jgi:hypothetical protein
MPPKVAAAPPTAAASAPALVQASQGETQTFHTTLSDEWESAIQHRLVSFYQMVTAYYQTLDGHKTRRLIAEHYYAQLLAGYQHAYGGIKQQYYGHNVVCAAVLTRQDRIDIITPAVNGRFAKALGLIAQCDALTIEINNVLEAGKDPIRTITETVYGVTVSALGVIEYTPEGEAPNADRLALVENQLAEARALYSKAAQRQARLRYFLGVLIGLAIAAPAMGLAALLIALGHIDGFSPVDFLGVASAGALGAAVSVLTRLSSNGLVLDVEADSNELLRLGAVRPFLGSVLGLAAYWLLAGGLIPIKVPSGSSAFNFYAGLAFLMGFSERFAQDMLSIGESNATKAARGAKAGGAGATGTGGKGGADAPPPPGEAPNLGVDDANVKAAPAATIPTKKKKQAPSSSAGCRTARNGGYSEWPRTQGQRRNWRQMATLATG